MMMDLFSGLGGASEAFIDDPNFNVIRVESNDYFEEIEETIIHDVRSQKIEDIVMMEQPRVIWASPPCLDFSNGYSAPKPSAARAGRDFTPDLSLMIRAKELIDMNPNCTWVIENVAGAIADFEPILGPPRQIIGPFVLWGNFPLLHMPRSFRHVKDENDARHSPIRSNIRAKIPIEISKALLQSINYQSTLEEYCTEEWGG